jgi:cysteine-rich repeat protein
MFMLVVTLTSSSAYGSHICGDGFVGPGQQCDDGNVNNGDCCSSTCQFEAAGSSCSTTNLCVTGSTCDGSGTCGTPVVCPAPGPCRTAGTCNSGTGVCEYPLAAVGASCDDDNACTTSEQCDVLGDCNGTAVVCAALDDCHVPGTCDSETGLCDNPPAADASPCSDNDACTVNDGCDDGVCVGGTPLVCGAQGPCFDAGTCDPNTGECSNPPSADGATCDDDDACTQSDTCDGSGNCEGADPVVCAAQDDCHVAGTCNANTGECSNPPAVDGTVCDDGDGCTQTDQCDGNGTCEGGNPVVCAAQDQCHDAGTCNPSTGECSNPAKADATPCDDANACTQTDGCASGVCTGGNPVVCTAQDQCHDLGTCDPNSGECSDPAKADGATCDDANELTYDDACAAGGCEGTPVTCGDAIVQEVATETCDAGAANGTDQCCSATCQIVDEDGDGTCDRDDACPNDATNDPDADTVCDDVDNCVGTANADQADADGDTIGDACDASDAPLGLTLARLRPGPFRNYTRAWVHGTVSTAENDLALEDGLTIRLRDGASFDQTRTLASAECSPPTASGGMACRADDGYVRIRFVPDRKTEDLYRFKIYVRRLPLTSSFEGPVTVTLTDGMGSRVGTADRCSTGSSTITCRPAPSSTKKKLE